MQRMLFTAALAAFALSLQPASACETAAKKVEPAHLTTTSLIPIPAVAAYEGKVPSIESLSVDSDFTVFMKAGVATDVRTAALRKLWRLNPAFGRSDGLDSEMVEAGR